MNAKKMQKLIRYSKAQLQEISCKDDDDAFHCLQKHEVGDVRMLVDYQLHLRATVIFPEDADTFRCNSITRKDHVSFADHPDAIALMSAIGDM